MGVLNVTTDSFSGDGLAGDTNAAVAQGLRLIAEGADILDIGGESSRPGASSVSIAEELRRVIPVIEGLNECGVPLSIDTTKPEVMRVALAAGASMVNDIGAFVAPGAMDIVAQSNAAVCLMHMQNDPATMQRQPSYVDVVEEVAVFLDRRVMAAKAAGIAGNRIVIDPGFGFGKTKTHNLDLLAHLDRFTRLGLPVLVGLSRKSVLGEVTGRPIGERATVSVVAAVIAVERGAKIVRVHDVAKTKDALDLLASVQS